MKKNIGTFLFVMIGIFIFLSSLAYTAWSGQINKKRVEQAFNLNIGTHPGDYSDNSLDNIPDFVPEYIIEKLHQFNDLPESIIDALVMKIVKIYFSNPKIELLLGSSIDQLFFDQQYELGPDRYLLYITDGEEKEIVLVHIDENVNQIPSNANQLQNALSHTWTGINKISPLWNSGVLYQRNHAAVDYDGELYFNLFDSRYIAPPDDHNNWFLVTDDLEFHFDNPVYPQGYITKVNNDYFIATQASWKVFPSSTVSWAWQQIFLWQETEINEGQIVITDDNDEVRFWRALKNTSDYPSTTTAISGKWQEIINGWVTGNELINRSYYFDHNTYAKDEIVIDGLTPNLRIRYFQAISNTPSGERPLIGSLDTQALVVNSKYWREI